MSNKTYPLPEKDKLYLFPSQSPLPGWNVQVYISLAVGGAGNAGETDARSKCGCQDRFS